MRMKRRIARPARARPRPNATSAVRGRPVNGSVPAAPTSPRTPAETSVVAGAVSSTPATLSVGVGAAGGVTTAGGVVTAVGVTVGVTVGVIVGVTVGVTVGGGVPAGRCRVHTGCGVLGRVARVVVAGGCRRCRVGAGCRVLGRVGAGRCRVGAGRCRVGAGRCRVLGRVVAGRCRVGAGRCRVGAGRCRVGAGRCRVGRCSVWCRVGGRLRRVWLPDGSAWSPDARPPSSPDALR